MSFNISVFCNLQGHYDDLSTIYNVVFGSVFLVTGLLITLCSGYVIFMGVFASKALRKKKNTFVLSLVISDLLFGVLFVPSFVAELYQKMLQADIDFCRVRSWRVVFFSYLFSCRMLSILFISLFTYIKTCKSRPRLDSVFSYLVRWTTAIVIWIAPAVVMISIAFSNAKNYKLIGTITYVYYFVSITIILISYLLTYFSIKKAENRGNSSMYREAIDFVRGILGWFIATTFLLGTCGLVLVIMAHDPGSHNSDEAEHHIYLAALFIGTLDAIANPVVYMRKFKEFQWIRGETFTFKGNTETVPSPVNTAYRSDSPHDTKYASIALPPQKV